MSASYSSKSVRKVLRSVSTLLALTLARDELSTTAAMTTTTTTTMITTKKECSLLTRATSLSKELQSSSLCLLKRKFRSELCINSRLDWCSNSIENSSSYRCCCCYVSSLCVDGIKARKKRPVSRVKLKLRLTDKNIADICILIFMSTVLYLYLFPF